MSDEDSRITFHESIAVPSQAQDPSSAKRLDLIALLVFPLFALLVCFPILQGKVPIASDTLYLWAPWSQLVHAPVHNAVLADSTQLSLSWASFARHSLAAGEWPLWDPYTFAGQPFASNPQNQLYYPLTWLFWLLPLSGAFQM